jgi:hypothetical protein
MSPHVAVLHDERDYSVLFGLAALGLIVGCRLSPAPQRPAVTPRVPPPAVARDEADHLMEHGDHRKAAG